MFKIIELIVPVIIILIIILQFYFFINNYNRMKELKEIFEDEGSWRIKKNETTGFVSGIVGAGNSIFDSIVISINKYLGNNSGSVIDFQLLKDAVDRHCDSVEEDINTQTPVPLYCGLAGTMAGVILGLIPLILSGALSYLLGGNDNLSDSADMNKQAAEGINELLKGVALAMTASICGIVLTTLSSMLFKRYKLVAESGKNSFLAWMQSSLLPELPSDTSDALNKLVKNLNRFNSVFATNTSELKSTLGKVNEAYRIQGDIIQSVKDMDVMKMAKANVKVLEELKDCTEELEKFGTYLTSVNEYTQIIKSFTEKFESESDRLHVLEEIRNFFTRHKGEIAKTTGDSDNALKEALASLKHTSRSSISEFNKELVSQSEAFKKILEEEKGAFEQMAKDMKAQFSSELKQMPMLEQNLKKISEIPAALEKMISRIEKSNQSLVQNVNQTMRDAAKAIVTQQPEVIDGSIGIKVGGTQPVWMRYSILGAVFVIAIACVTNTVYNICKTETSMPNRISTDDMTEMNSVSEDTIIVDSVEQPK